MVLMVVQAVLFDMDGVVVDTEQSVTAFWRRIACLHGVTLAVEDLQRYAPQLFQPAPT